MERRGFPPGKDFLPVDLKAASFLAPLARNVQDPALALMLWED